jgi:hypothetical protein
MSKIPLLLSIGIYITRHPGRDCRDPEAMDGNTELRHKFCRQGIVQFNQQFFSRTKSLLELFCHTYTHHILVLWIPAIPAGKTVIRFV